MLKITAIVPYTVFPPKMGGQKGIALFYSYLGKIIPSTLLTTSDSPVPASYPAEIRSMMGKSVLRYINPFLFFKIKKILKSNSSTHLILEHPYYGWLGILLKSSTGINLVIHSHNIESVRFKTMKKWWWKILWSYEKMTHQNADESFFITEEDRLFAIENFGLNPSKAHCITYGFELSAPPEINKKLSASKELRQLYCISEKERIYLFNGTLDYKPNLDALDVILNKIDPNLSLQNDQYKIIICGKSLPLSYKKLLEERKNIIYAGFVNDIDTYFLGSDIFLNPLLDGGGIKTKLVEALGNNLSVVSTKSGAIGVPLKITGNKLKIVDDGNWEEFTESIIKTNTEEIIPTEFFKHFYWYNIAAKAAKILDSE